jgi:hypothetical protein
VAPNGWRRFAGSQLWAKAVNAGEVEWNRYREVRLRRNLASGGRIGNRLDLPDSVEKVDVALVWGR